MEHLFLRLVVFVIAYRFLEDTIEIEIKSSPRIPNSDKTSYIRFLIVLVIVFYDVYPEVFSEVFVWLRETFNSTA